MRDAMGAVGYRDGAAFELFGLDMVVDEDLKPTLLEVNAMPSMAVKVIHSAPLGTCSMCSSGPVAILSPSAAAHPSAAQCCSLLKLLVQPLFTAGREHRRSVYMVLPLCSSGQQRLACLQGLTLQDVHSDGFGGADATNPFDEEKITLMHGIFEILQLRSGTMSFNP